jgi:hypothetical protein
MGWLVGGAGGGDGPARLAGNHGPLSVILAGPVNFFFPPRPNNHRFNQNPNPWYFQTECTVSKTASVIYNLQAWLLVL